jgi:hypothetical protein
MVMLGVPGLLTAGLLLLPGGDPAPGCAAGPPPVAWWAVPGRTGAYRGDYVGGGSALGGEPRLAEEGTWGWDYEGCLLLRRVWLKWTHGRRCQGGEGAYKIDGPPVPNIFAVPPPRSQEGEHE